MAKTLADENIPFVKEAFGHFGQVHTLPGRAITPASLREVELLVVRSITRVDEKLLRDSRVKFVGTATIGTDHLDLRYLKQRKISVASAPGSNAVSVAEYVVAALLTLAGRKGFALRGMSLGIVGAGHVGGEVARRGRALGLNVILHDPPLREKTGSVRYRPLREALACDIVTLHVPLTRHGRHATFRMANRDFFGKMKTGAILFNTSRGDVIDPKALHAHLGQGRLGGLVLDVWPGEPVIDLSLLRKADLATPHIAGYSYDGKVKGTEMVYRAAAKILKTVPRWTLRLPKAPRIRLSPCKNAAAQTALRGAVASIYNIEGDDARLRKLLKTPASERGAYFDRLRKEYPVRREFSG